MGKVNTDSYKESSDANLPVRLNLKFLYINTLILVILIIAVSIIGIFFQNEVYQSEELSVIFVPNDILNLALSVPLLIVFMILTIRKNLVGLLCYPGALFYITYVYTTYLLGLPFNSLFIPYLLLVLLSSYTIIGLLVSFDSEKIRQKLTGHVPIKISGVIIFSLTCLFIAFQSYSILNSLINQLDVDQIMLAQWIDDLIIAAPPAIIIGIFMIQRKSLGYTSGVSLLLLFSMLFFGLVPVLIIKGILTGTPVNFLDILIVAASSMICFIPFILFVKGISKVHNKSNSVLAHRLLDKILKPD